MRNTVKNPLSLLDEYPKLKLQNFCDDHALSDMPALVWSCAPVDPVEVNPREKGAAEILRGARIVLLIETDGGMSSRPPTSFV